MDNKPRPSWSEDETVKCTVKLRQTCLNSHRLLGSQALMLITILRLILIAKQRNQLRLAHQKSRNKSPLFISRLLLKLLERVFLVLGTKRSTGINWNLLITFKGFHCNQCSWQLFTYVSFMILAFLDDLILVFFNLKKNIFFNLR